MWAEAAPRGLEGVPRGGLPTWECRLFAGPGGRQGSKGSLLSGQPRPGMRLCPPGGRIRPLNQQCPVPAVLIVLGGSPFANLQRFFMT